MKYLFIDTSSNLLTIAVLDDNKILDEYTYISENDQSKYAIFELDNMFNRLKMDPNDIDKILVVNGPGSFTGVRIGVTIAKIYAWSLNKSVIPVSTLKAYALSLDSSDYYTAVIDARRNHVYAGVYNNNYNEVLPESYIEIDKLKDFIKTLKGKISIMGNIDINNELKTYPVKLDVLKIVNYYKNDSSINAHKLNPKYLKKVEAEEKLMEVIK